MSRPFRIRILLAVALALSVAGGASARSERSTADQDAAAREIARFEAALPKLDLWPEQKPRIQKLLRQVKADLKKIRSAPGTPEQKKPRLRALRERAMQSLNRIITVAQAERLKQLMAAPKKPAPRR